MNCKKFSHLLILLLICFLNNIKITYAKMINFDLDIKDHHFQPSEIILPERTKIKLIVHNKDASIEEFESFDLKREKIIPPKSKKNIILAPLKTGEYSFFGEFHEDTAQGKLIIVTQEEYDKYIKNQDKDHKQIDKQNNEQHNLSKQEKLCLNNADHNDNENEDGNKTSEKINEERDK